MHSLVKIQLSGVAVEGPSLVIACEELKPFLKKKIVAANRINDPRENRIPKLQLSFGNQRIYFYSCTIKEMPKGFEKGYDWTGPWSPT